MPFMGKDWRSPGEAWVKTGVLGWQRMKLIESQLHPICHQFPACSWPPNSEYGQHMEKNCQGNRFNCSDYDSSGIGSSPSTSSRENSSSPNSSCSESAEKRFPSSHLHNQIQFPITISSPYGQFSYEQNSQMPMNCENGNSPQNPSSLFKENKQVQQEQDDHTEQRDFQSIRTKFSQMRSKETVQRSKPIDIKTEASSRHQSRILEKPSLLVNSRAIKGNHSIRGSSTVDKYVKLELSEADKVKSINCSRDQTISTDQRRSRSCTRTAPHCRISVRTREVAMYNTISEAFYRLDFCNAVHDIRRFNYICKLLHLLITQNLTSLSGCATKVLFTMLEQIACEVSTNKRNIHVLRNLLDELKMMIQKYYCWGQPIGSSALWQQHFDTIERINSMLDGIELSNPKIDEEKTASWNSLPIEMVREILLRLNDYRDLLNIARASPMMKDVVNDQYLWQKLCRYHFTEEQIKFSVDTYKCWSTKRLVGTRVIKNSSKANGNTTSNSNKNNFKDSQNSALNNFGAKISQKNVQKRRPKDLPHTRELEPTNKHRAPNHPKIHDKGSDRSYVTKAIEIFDKESSVITTKSDIMKRGKNKESSKRDKQVNNARCSKDLNENLQIGASGSSNDSTTSNPFCKQKLSREKINWELVFHQLRKKYGLKEEYADCLLLCRQCRCLFWKSIGHPCVENEDQHKQEDKGCSHCPNPCLIDLVGRHNHQPPCHNNQDSEGPSRNMTSRFCSTTDNSLRSQTNQVRRLSVAMLSRSFDRRAQDMLESNSRQVRSGPKPDRSSLSNSRSSENASSNIGEPRIPLIIRNQNFLNPGNVNENGQNNTTGQKQSTSSDKLSSKKVDKDSLLPKHVAISPQAFLKFFSL